MPNKNSTKQYYENGYYHIYNRGIEKRKIFLDKQDYQVFLSYLSEYLLPKNEDALQKNLADPNTSYKEREQITKQLIRNNFFDQITMFAYCLMPNHFHFLIKQNHSMSMDKFMNSLATRYTMYFNKKHKRVGSLYQDVYKAVSVKTDEQLLHLSRYIHHQSLRTSRKSKTSSNSASQGDALRGWKLKQMSSFPDYLGMNKKAWVNTKEILGYFSQVNPEFGYEKFVVDKIPTHACISKMVIEGKR